MDSHLGGPSLQGRDVRSTTALRPWSESTSLTVVIIARDAASCLPHCLRSVAGWHDVLVVVDDRSTDETEEVARLAGAYVLRLAWQGGFAEQRNAAAALSATDWVLFIDADEEVTPELRTEVDRVLRVGPRMAAFEIPRRNNLLGHWMVAGGWRDDRQVRLMNRLETRYIGSVHEVVDSPPESLGSLRGRLLHHTHRSVSDVVQKAELYSGLEAEQAEAANQSRPSLLSAYLLPLAHLLARYVFLAGFLDGRVGLAEARLQAYYRHLTLIRRRYGPEAIASSVYTRLIPSSSFSSEESAAIQPLSLAPPKDPLSIGLGALLILLPFHLVLKRFLPGPLGEGWKEMLIAVLLLWALIRLRRALYPVARMSWLARLAIAYVVLVVLRALLEPHLAAALQGARIDVTYIALLVVMLAVPVRERLAVLAFTTLGIGGICGLGAVVEVLLSRPLFPSRTLLEQYGHAQVYINGTHVLRPYFTFDFPTGLGAYLAVGTVIAVALFVGGRRLWPLPLAGLCGLGLMLTFSRGPWVGALAGLAAVAYLARGRSPLLRLGTVAGLTALLLASAILTNGGGRAHARVIRLISSSTLRGVDGPTPAERLSQSFIRDRNLVERRGLPAPASKTASVFWRIGRARAWVLEEPPPAKGDAVLGYRVRVPDGALLDWGIVLNPAVWAPERGDGVTFRVAIDDGGQTSVLFARYLDPKNDPADRRIFAYRLPLFGYAGDTVRVEFMTDAGPMGDADYDWAAWVNPRLVTVSISTNLNAYPYRIVPISGVERPINRSGPYLASIADWQYDSSNTDRLAAWSRTMHAWRADPIVGIGPGTVDEAALRTDQAHPLITESQVGKVLVETGLLGLAVWLGICGLALWIPFRAYRSQVEAESLVCVGGVLCILVASLAFQVLEVKQIAALFWVFAGVAVGTELTLRGVEIPVQEVPFSQPMLRTIQGLWAWTQGRRGPEAEEAVAPPMPEPDSVDDLTFAPQVETLPIDIQGMDIDLDDGDGAALQERDGPLEVAVLDDGDRVNEHLRQDWRLLSSGVSQRGPVFVVGRRRLRE